MNPPRRNAVVLILVLVVIALLALVALGFAELMLSERKGAVLAARQAQARVSAESGAELARQFLDAYLGTQNSEAGSWYDNPRFHGAMVVDDPLPRDRSRFTIIAPRVEDRAASGVRYGLEDESGRINLRTLLKSKQTSKQGQQTGTQSQQTGTQGQQTSPKQIADVGTQGEQAGTKDEAAEKVLMGLPGMTETIAEAILDWIDEDDETRQQGAERDYYSSLTPPYAPRNGPPATIEELLLVRGVTPQLLFGADAAHMARGLTSAATSEGADTVDNSDGSMTHGWAAYLTLYSAESNLTPDGQPKINLNQSDLTKLYDDLETALGVPWATFIVAYRQSGPQEDAKPGSNKAGDSKSGDSDADDSAPDGKQPTNAKNVATAAPSGKLDLSKKASATLTSVLDLVGVKTKAKYEGQQEEVVLASPIPDERSVIGSDLAKLIENTATSDESIILGRININQAPRAVLNCIPGLTSEIIDQIISRRTLDPSMTASDRRQATWLLTEGVVPLKTMKSLMPLVTGEGGVYRANVVGYFESGGPTARIEVILDATKRPAGMLFWRDVSHLGIGYPMDVLGAGSGE